MRRRVLGSSGIEVGAIGLGCMGMSWAYGGERDDDESIRVIRHAIDLGANLIDTADMYGPFTNEELVGRALRGRRDEVVLATKCGNVVDPETRTVRQDGRPEHVKAACEGSLHRLGVEVIDLYQLHRPDPKVPVSESIGAFGELIDEGKIRAIGVSELGVAQLEEAITTRPIASLQSELSLWTRDVLPEILPWCVAHDLAFLAFSPLGRGFLTGGYRSAEAFGRGDFRSRLPRFQAEALEQNLAIVDAVSAVAARRGRTTGQVALAWVLAQGEQVVPIPGTKRLAHLEENLAADDVRLSDDDLGALDRVPAPVGARY